MFANPEEAENKYEIRSKLAYFTLIYNFRAPITPIERTPEPPKPEVPAVEHKTVDVGPKETDYHVFSRTDDKAKLAHEEKERNKRLAEAMKEKKRQEEEKKRIKKQLEDMKKERQLKVCLFHHWSEC